MTRLITLIGDKLPEEEEEEEEEDIRIVVYAKEGSVDLGYTIAMAISEKIKEVVKDTEEVKIQ